MDGPQAGIDVRALRPYITDHEKRLSAIENIEVHIHPIIVNVVAPNTAGTGQVVIGIPVCPTTGRVERTGDKLVIILGR